MIRTQPIPFAELIKDIPSGEPVGIIGCGDCAAVLNTGGTKQVDALRESLHERNPVRFSMVVDAPCDQRVLRRMLGLIKGFKEARHIILLACPAGAQSLAPLLEEDTAGIVGVGAGHRLHVGLKATGLAWVEKNGQKHSGCLFCSDCTFVTRKKVCPTAACPLHRADGPCQTRLLETLCPVKPDLHCVWLSKEDTIAVESLRQGERT